MKHPSMHARRNGLLGVCLFIAFATAVSQQNNAVRWSAFDMGYSPSATGNSSVMSVVGQGIAGTVQGSGSRVLSGFLANPRFHGLIVSVAEDRVLPERFQLEQNYPNPFNPATTISFDLPVSSRVTVAVFDILGRLVRTLVSETLPAGRHARIFDALGIASGTYLVRFAAQPADGGRGFTAVRKLMVVK